MSKAKTILSNVRCRVLIVQPWYGTVISRFKWIENEKIETMGVRVMPRGIVECMYAPEFLEKYTVDQLIAVTCHEVEHIIRMHCARDRFIQDIGHKHLWNIACDWVINGTRSDKRIENLPDEGTFIPVKSNNEDAKQWKGCDIDSIHLNGTAEEFYEWLKNNVKTEVVEGSNGKAVVTKTKGGHIIQVTIIDNHDTWGESQASAEDMRTTAKDLARAATQRTAGKVPGHLEEAIAALQKPQHNWIYQWRNIIGRVAGNKRRTYSRRARRRDSFGVKGVSRHASIKLVIGVDTSGSMSQKMLQRVFSEVEAMSQHFKIYLVQFDTQVNDVSEYHRGDWKKIKLKGRGGTDFESFFQHLEDHKMVGKMNCIVTDGFDALPRKRNYPVTWVVIGKQGVEYLEKQGELWGEKVLIKHDYEDEF